MFKDKTILVTGGTGSFGKKFIEVILRRYPDIKKIIVYSRDELKQFEMSQNAFFRVYDKKMRYFIGDVRDPQRLKKAFEYVDIVIHAAALKQVPAAEYNPFECIKTNVIGAQNVIDACFDNKVEHVVALSTDKAAAPINLYGASKLCSDKLFVAANNTKGQRNIKFSVVRYGNVFGSRGSVVPFFLQKKSEGILPITHEEMTRFSITLEEGVAIVLGALQKAWGGEIFVPKIPSYKITTLAKAIAPECKTIITGIRPGEKLHEEMITESDALNTLDCGSYYVVLPSVPTWDTQKFKAEFKADCVPNGFSYNSGTNTEWLNESEIKILVSDFASPESHKESLYKLHDNGQKLNFESSPLS